MTTSLTTEKTIITERQLLDMKFLAWVDKKGEPHYNRAYIEHHPRAYWDATDVYVISIHCEANYSGDYYLHISRSGREDKFFCFLINGKWSQTFIHLRQVTYFEELQELVWALTRCKLFKSEFDLKEYVKPLIKE